ncbi:Lactonase 7-bladed beta-propeller [Gracilaria domingensis]|nr:Lactonase 7-bladed beta-propeller [Gracilaria domingensis]
MVLPYKDSVIVPDAGSDIVWHFKVNATDGQLTMLKRIKMNLEDAPRHAAKHPTTDTVYVVGEISTTISVLKPEGCGEGLSVCSRIDVLEEKPEDVSLAAIRVTSDGRFLYVSVRYPGTENGYIAGYRLNDRTGDIQAKIGMWDAFGVHPRDFYVIERAGFEGRCISFVAVVHRDTDNLVLIERDRGSGMLMDRPAMELNVSSPTSVIPIW